MQDDTPVKILCKKLFLNILDLAEWMIRSWKTTRELENQHIVAETSNEIELHNNEERN